MPPLSYHVLTISNPAYLKADDGGDLLVAGDGVYQVVPCFGMSLPLLLVSCEIRGLLPLVSLLDTVVQDTHPPEAKDDPLPFAPSHHVLVQPGLPALDASRMYQYVIAYEGVFLLAGCPGIEVLMPISLPCQLPTLSSVQPFVTWKYPRVGEEVIQEILHRARAARDMQHGTMLERLFYLTWEEGWHVYEPEQATSEISVRALASTDADEMAIIEGHSHHDMRAYFSLTDNQDELINGGFKVYFVLGRIHDHPQIRTRVCVHGYSWEVPARIFFALSADVEDCVAMERGEKWC